MRRRSLVLCAALGLVACGGGEDPFRDPLDPSSAPVASVDRFGSYATLFNREMPAFDPERTAPNVPEPNAPIDFDAMFLVKALGPAGENVTYYGLDIAPAEPARAYVVVGLDGAPVPGQLPIVASRPGDEGYNDFVRVSEVNVGDDYQANALTSVAQVDEAASLGRVAIVETDRVQNWALVPAGSIATRRFDGEPVSGHQAWIGGEVVHYLQFDRALEASSNGNVPASNVSVIFENGMDPSAGFAMEPDGQTHNVVETLPGEAGYSSWWAHQMGARAGFDDVTDWPSAIANYEAKLPVFVNCPVVTE